VIYDTAGASLLTGNGVRMAAQESQECRRRKMPVSRVEEQQQPLCMHKQQDERGKLFSLHIIMKIKKILLLVLTLQLMA
jgi:hypothetical protein